MADPVIDTPAGSTDAIEIPAAIPPLGVRIFKRIGEAFTYRDFRNLWLAAFSSAVGT